MNIAFFCRAISGACLLLLFACSDGPGQGDSSAPETFTVGGSVSGLTAGKSLVLSLGGGESVQVTSDAAYQFNTRQPRNGSYVVTIGTQPAGETCSLTNASGAGMTANVTNVDVTCSVVTYAISGVATGLLAGQQVTLANGSDAVVVSQSGTFSFATRVNEGGNFDVVVSSPASNETCTVSGGSGAGVDADVNSIAVTCSADRYTVGGTISGLSAGQQVTLRDNGADSLTVAANGAFTFATPVAFAAGYVVTVATQPAQEICSIGAGSGSGAGVNSNVSSVALVCAVNTYSISGTVTGLLSGQALTLVNNGADPVKVTGNGSGTDGFAFAAPVAYQGSYAVSVATQPTNETCSVASGTGAGSGVNAAVSKVALSCSRNSYDISGAVTGLAKNQRLTLFDNGGDALTITGGGSGTDAFKFGSGIAFGGSYTVTIGTQPTNQVCSLANGSGAGSGVNADVSSVALTCSSDSYSIAGSVSGLAAGQAVTIMNNGTGAVTVTGGGSGTDPFQFAKPVSYLGSYAVTISSQPRNEVCSVSAGSGSAVSANVSTAAIKCSVDSYSIGGTISGLGAGQSLTLADNGGNGGDTSTLQGTGSTLAFAFANKVAYLGSYAVTVSTQPVGQFCDVAGGSGANVGAAVSGITVSCVRAWYVSGSGVDSHDGKTAATAFRTLARAAAFVSPGDVVLAMNGTYTNDSGGAVLSLNMAGSADAWITYRAYPGHFPLIQTDGIWGGITFGASARYIEVNGFTVTGNNPSLTLAGAQAVETNPSVNPKYNGNCIAAQANQTSGIYPQHLRILNNTVSQCPGAGIATVGADYVTISGNTVYDTALYSAYGCSGISTLNDYDSNPSDKSTTYKMVITNNVVYGNQELIAWLSAGYISDGEGIIIDSNHNHDYVPTVAFPAYTGRTLIANNVVYANGSAAIEVFQSSHVDVVNNSTFGDVTTPTGPSAAVAKVTGRGEMNLGQISDVKVYNNIFYSLSGQNPITQSSACSDCEVDYNIYYGGTNSWGKFGANGLHDKVADPLYVNAVTSKPASTSLKLRAGSPAIGAGTSHLAPGVDINGSPRPSPAGYTIGAYSQ